MPTTYAIPNGRTVFDATLYTGTGAAANVTNQTGFKPDFVWQKARNQANSHVLIDSVRGVNQIMYSNLTNAEATGTNALNTFNSNGFTGGGDNVVSNGNTSVAWQWQAGQGTTSTNTAGSITSTVSVNASAGFSIVTWTGNGVSSATVGHGLGVQPAMVIAKCRSATNDWSVTHQGIPSSFIYLNSTGAAATGGGTNGAMNYQSTYTSSVFGFLAGSSTVNNVNANGSTYVAYCWSEVAGFSKFGSYTGNGSADGPFVYLGFKPAYILLKRTDSTSDWIVEDNKRLGYNVDNNDLVPNTTAAEATDDRLDFLSNGFKLRSTFTSTNANGGTYVYACFAENPFKFSNAR